MTLRLVLSGVFVIVLAVSLLLKLPVNTDVTVAAQDSMPAKIAALLDRHGFQVRKAAPESDPPWVVGRAGACHVQIAEVAPQGWHRSLVTQVAAGKQLFYIFDGETHPEQPILRTWARHYLSKLHSYVGLSPPYRSVLAVVAAPACENLALSELVDLSGGHFETTLGE